MFSEKTFLECIRITQIILLQKAQIFLRSLAVRMERRVPRDRIITTVFQFSTGFPFTETSPKFQKLQRSTESIITLPSAPGDSLFLFLGLRFPSDFPPVLVRAFVTPSCPLVDTGSSQQHRAFSGVHSTPTPLVWGDPRKLCTWDIGSFRKIKR